VAIDTAAKRASCVGLALLFLRTGARPDASDLSAAQRLHAEGLYSGIAADSPTVVLAPASRTAYVEPEARTVYVPPETRTVYVEAAQ
jgi:hypothetical protein